MDYVEPIDTSGYTPVYRQDFAGTRAAVLAALNTSYMWSRETIINDEVQKYLESQVDVVDVAGEGRALALTFEAANDSDGDMSGTYNGEPRTQAYKSGVVTSQGHAAFGPWFRATVRAKYPPGAGLWGAFWFLKIGDQWPKDRDMADEIDGPEILGKDPANAANFASHYMPRGDAQHWDGQVLVDGLDVYGEFNDWVTEVSPAGITFGVNGAWLRRFPLPAEYANEDAVWHWLANLAGGGTWAGPIDDSALPATMYVSSVLVEIPGAGNVPPADGAPDESPKTGAEIDKPEPEANDVVGDVERAGPSPAPAAPAPQDVGTPDEDTSDDGYAFRVDPATKELTWKAQPGAAKYNVYLDSRYVEQVDAPYFRATAAGNYKVQPLDADNVFGDMSPSIGIDAGGRTDAPA